MDRTTVFFILLAFCGRSSGRQPFGDSYTVTGFFGCRFGPVCTEGEVCVDDALFGNCQNPERSQGVDRHQYRLSSDYLKLLSGQLENLVVQGYAWKHLYTQCVIGNLLLSYRIGLEPDLTFCDQETEEDTVSDRIDPSTMSLLVKLIDDYNDDTDVQKREDLDQSELVQVHKYLKERKSILPEEEVQRYLASLSTEDLIEMKEELGAMEKQLLTREDTERDSELEADSLPEIGQESERRRDEETALIASDPNDLGEQRIITGGGEKITDAEKEELSLTPEEAKLIFDLIEGKDLPPDLSENDVDRLTEAVSDILKRVKEDQAVEVNDEEMSLGALTAEDMTPGGEVENYTNVEAKTNEDQLLAMNDNEALKHLETEIESEEWEPTEKRMESQVRVQKYVSDMGPGYNFVEDDGVGVEPDEKKEDVVENVTHAPADDLEPNVVTDSQSIYVDARYVFVEANRSFKNEEEALRFLGNLQYKLKLPPGSFSDAKWSY